MLRLLLLYLTINHRVHFIVTDEISDDAEELKNAPPDHIIPYSEHEDPPEPPTKPKYIAPGEWAKPSPNKSVTLDFVPTRIYTQVRRTHTTKRVPREEALKHATNDEERENAARLKEVVTKRKINTVYTEEGYEDAAYDHGGRTRDANINENHFHNNLVPKIRAKKQRNESNSDEIDDDISEIDPKFIVENEVGKLEDDLDKEDQGAAKRAETEVPENLRDLTDDSDSYDYEDEQNAETTKQDYDYDDRESDLSTSTELLTNNSEETPAIDVSTKISTTVKNPEVFVNTPAPTDLPFRDFSLDLKQLSSFEDVSSPSDYGHVFWEYFKTEKPITTTTIAQSRKHQIPSSKIEQQVSASSKNAKDNTPIYPSLSQIYESWKQRGIEQSYDGSSPKHVANGKIETTTLTNSEKSTETNNEQHVTEKKLKKNYMEMVRSPKKLKTDSRIRNSSYRGNRVDYNGHRDDEHSVDPEIGDSTAGKNMTVIYPAVPTPLGQVTYTDFLQDTYGNLINPTVTQESGSSMEQTIPETTSHSSDTAASLVGPATTPPIYRYHPHQLRHHRHHSHQQHRPLTRQNRKRQILSLIEMLPPSPVRHSEYAQYYAQNRIRGVKSDHDPSSNAYKNYPPVFHYKGKTSHRTKRTLTMIDMGLDSEKVPVKGVKINYRSIDDEKLNLSREKRNSDGLLVKAPIIVDEVINKEIESRFPADSNEDDGAEKNSSMSSEYEQRDNVEVEVPEYNFSDIAGAQDDDEEDEYNSPDAAEVNDRVEDERDADESSDELIDNDKYPFYNNNQISRASPLKYAINPHLIPGKTPGGYEFYESRDRYMKCDDIEKDLSKVLPKDEEPSPDGDVKRNLPRLRNLGDKLSCLRDKYFDKNPLDNPLFKEKYIEPPEMPKELNPVALKLAFSTLVGDSEANIARRVSRKPEIIDLRPSTSRTNHVTERSEKNKSDQKNWNNHARRYRGRHRTSTAVPDVVYQRQVYEDVMGTIKNMAHMYQSPPVLSNPSLQQIRIGKAKTKNNLSLESSRERDENIGSHHAPPRHDTSPTPLNVPQITWRYKLSPYRTNRVSYKTRPRIDSVPGSNIPRVVGYFKTVRVHKRSVNIPGSNMNTSKGFGDNIFAGNTTKRRRMRRPTSTVVPEVSTQASQRIYSIDDRLKHSKPRGRVRYGQFTTESTTSTENVRRNEPRYTPVRKFDDDIGKLKFLNEKSDSADDTMDTEIYGSIVKRGGKGIGRESQYDVHEDVQERTTEAPIILGTDKSEDNLPVEHSAEDEGSGQSYESPSATNHEEESRDDENEEEGEGKEADDDESGDEDEQVERPSESYTQNSGEGSGEDGNEEESSHEASSYDAEKNASFQSKDEEEFERFGARPFSPFDSNYDEKYSDLGPRVSKPAFHHPSFDTLKSKKKLRNHEQSDDSSVEFGSVKGGSEYTFPWQQDDEGASGESRRYEKFSGKHEYPWERRERLAKQRGPSWKYDSDADVSDEQHKAGSITRTKQIYPWEQYDVPSRGFGVSSAANYFSPMYEFDNYGFSSQFRPVRFSSKYQSKLKPPKKYIQEKIQEMAKMNEKLDRNDDTVPTTFVSQIPATSATLPSLTRETTTPLSKTSTRSQVYTVRPRSRALATTRSRIQTTTSVPSQFRRTGRRRQVVSMKNNDQISSNTFTRPENRRRSRMTTLSSTMKPSVNRTDISQDSKHDSTLPPTTSRTTEHRSKVSKEEIITTMSFPNSRTANSERESSSPKNEVVNKVSIVTKETPEHIYRTEEVDKDGIKDTFFSILPNYNNNQTSMELGKTTTIDEIEMEGSSDVSDLASNSPGFDINFPIPTNAMLSEHGTRKVMSSISWISENYDF